MNARPEHRAREDGVALSRTDDDSQRAYETVSTPFAFSNKFSQCIDKRVLFSKQFDIVDLLNFQSSEAMGARALSLSRKVLRAWRQDQGVDTANVILFEWYMYLLTDVPFVLIQFPRRALDQDM